MGKNIKIFDIKVWAQRISYVGELGFELYVNKKDALDLYKILTKEAKLGLSIVACMQWI